jgi:uncharacterized protein YjbI with pentapeptide repeats
MNDEAKAYFHDCRSSGEIVDFEHLIKLQGLVYGNLEILDHAERMQRLGCEDRVWESWLMGADFSSLNLQGIDFDEVNLNEVNFSKANLQGAKLDECELKNTNFKDANLTDCTFYGLASNWVGSNIHQSGVRGES